MTDGRGIYAEVEGRRLFCGSEKFFADNGIDINEKVRSFLRQLYMEGKATILVAEEKTCIGLIALSDVLRPESKKVISRLADMCVKSILLTGDNKKAAEYFAKQAGILEVKSELMPQEKMDYIKEQQKKGRMVCMIGDGVNDAPALKTADVSVAMGKMGSDITVESAEIVLISDDISKIPYLKRLSNATVSTIKRSIALSMCINFMAIILSLLGVLNPTTGALVHNGGSCLVVLIAALLYDRKFE